jgi:hypothetical protein
MIQHVRPPRPLAMDLAQVSATLSQLRFTSLTVVSLREDLHLQDCAHAGRTIEKAPS